MTKFRLAALACSLVIATTGSVVALAETLDLTGIHCLFADKAVNPEKSADYKDGKVYFCCGNCLGKFKESPEEVCIQRHMQLVATKQYVQKSCPLSGGPLNPDTKLKVGDADVTFCCNNCKGKVAGAEPAEQLEMGFSDKAFEESGLCQGRSQVDAGGVTTACRKSRSK